MAELARSVVHFLPYFLLISSIFHQTCADINTFQEATDFVEEKVSGICREFSARLRRFEVNNGTTLGQCPFSPREPVHDAFASGDILPGLGDNPDYGRQITERASSIFYSEQIAAETRPWEQETALGLSSVADQTLQASLCISGTLLHSWEDVYTGGQGGVRWTRYLDARTGLSRIFPGITMPPDQSRNLSIDARLSQAFVQTVSPQKDVVIVVDITIVTHQSVMRQAMSVLLQTLSPWDKIAVIINGDLQFSQLQQVTLPFPVSDLLDKILPDDLSPEDTKSALQAGVAALQDSSACIKAVLYLTDHAVHMETVQSVLEGLSEDIQIFTYTFNPSINPRILQHLACATKGSWEPITDDVTMVTRLTRYYGMHYPLNGSAARWTTIVPDRLSAGNLSSRCCAVPRPATYDPLQSLFGVLCVDLSVNKLQQAGATDVHVLENKASVVPACPVQRYTREEVDKLRPEESKCSRLEVTTAGQLRGFIEQAVRTTAGALETAAQVVKLLPTCPYINSQYDSCTNTTPDMVPDQRYHRPISNGTSNIHLTDQARVIYTNTSDSDPYKALLDSLCVSSSAEIDWLSVFQQNSGARWQFFIDAPTGYTRLYPSVNDLPESCQEGGGVDPRSQSWYAGMTSPAKDVAIIVDPALDDSLDIMKAAAKLAVNTVSKYDTGQLMVARQQLHSDGFQQGTETNRQTWLETVDRITSATHSTTQDLISTIKTAMGHFKDKHQEEDTKCFPVLLLLTNRHLDLAVLYETAQENTSHLGVRVFTFTFGQLADDPVAKQLACDSKGSWAVVKTMEDLHLVREYYGMLSPGEHVGNVLWSEARNFILGMDSTWEVTLQQSQYIAWQFYGDQASRFLRIYPALKETQEQCSNKMTDLPIRTWFSSAASSPKDVIIILDPHYAENLSLLKTTATALIATLTRFDFANILTTSGQQFVSGMLRAYADVRTAMVEFLNQADVVGETDLRRSFVSVQGIVDHALQSSNTTHCVTAVILITDFVVAPSVLEHLRGKAFRVFSYTIGPWSDRTNAKRVSCENMGTWTHIASLEDVWTKMADYYNYFSMNEKTNNVIWTEPYQDRGWSFQFQTDHPYIIKGSALYDVVNIIDRQVQYEDIVQYMEEAKDKLAWLQNATGIHGEEDSTVTTIHPSNRKIQPETKKGNTGKEPLTENAKRRHDEMETRCDRKAKVTPANFSCKFPRYFKSGMNPEAPDGHDCADILQKSGGKAKSGIYVIKPLPHGSVKSHRIMVLCHMEGGRGWTVIQRRRNNRESFYRKWSTYEQGFGHPCGNVWLGNRHIYQLTHQKQYVLQIYMMGADGKENFADYDSFLIEGEEENYKLRLGSYGLGEIVSGCLPVYDIQSEFLTLLGVTCLDLTKQRILSFPNDGQEVFAAMQSLSQRRCPASQLTETQIEKIRKSGAKCKGHQVTGVFQGTEDSLRRGVVTAQQTFTLDGQACHGTADLAATDSCDITAGQRTNSTLILAAGDHTRTSNMSPGSSPLYKSLCVSATLILNWIMTIESGEASRSLPILHQYFVSSPSELTSHIRVYPGVVMSGQQCTDTGRQQILDTVLAETQNNVGAFLYPKTLVIILHNTRAGTKSQMVQTAIDLTNTLSQWDHINIVTGQGTVFSQTSHPTEDTKDRIRSYLQDVSPQDSDVVNLLHEAASFFEASANVCNGVLFLLSDSALSTHHVSAVSVNATVFVKTFGGLANQESSRTVAMEIACQHGGSWESADVPAENYLQFFPRSFENIRDPVWFNRSHDFLSSPDSEPVMTGCLPATHGSQTVGFLCAESNAHQLQARIKVNTQCRRTQLSQDQRETLRRPEAKCSQLSGKGTEAEGTTLGVTPEPGMPPTGMGPGKIIGIVIGCLLIIALVAGPLLWYYKKRHNDRVDGFLRLDFLTDEIELDGDADEVDSSTTAPLLTNQVE
ncbi:PREDICTED: uncharacterized protein LOC109464547 [Branchiostoma belcheri]|uniref:Uncharacterized protein LOC109464547 n=1 Tax=Branchiostoma belcheri TaxID=7741 RepID=A0A6P4Y3Z7_BRABE|nr:PREDICTED: uncharacterized protein LOC109464547 [Branchiostoma belcheri]